MKFQSFGTLALLALALTLGPAAQAQPMLQEPFSSDCTNNGIIIQASLGGSAINCDGECTNNGIIIQASTSTTYTCDGGCTNRGVIVWGPRTDGSSGGCGSETWAGLPGACVSNVCEPATCNFKMCEITLCDYVEGLQCSPEFNAVQTTARTDGVCGVNGEVLSRLEIECGKGQDCSVLANPACWSIRLGCTLADNQTRIPDILDEFGIHCRTWTD